MMRISKAILLACALFITSSCSGTSSSNIHNFQHESNGDSAIESETMATKDQESSIADPLINYDLFIELDLEDGEFTEIPWIEEDEVTVYQDTDEYIELIIKRLQAYGVYLSSKACEEIYPTKDSINYLRLSLFIGHYQDLDILYIRYPGYRGNYSGNLHVYENSMFKESTLYVGLIDFDNCFRQIDDHIWLVVTGHTEGSGLGIEYRQWIKLNETLVTADLTYTNFYGTNNYSYETDIDFILYLTYNVMENDLYIDNQGLPVLSLHWQKEVYDEDRIITIVCDGYVEHVIDGCMADDQFSPHDLYSGELVNGLEDQLHNLIDNGTEEERNIAKQIVDNFT